MRVIVEATLVGNLGNRFVRLKEHPCGVSDAGQPLSMNELATLMIRDPTTVKRQLDRLVKRQFVERNASSEDARSVMISLTRRGEQKLQTVLPLLDDLRKAALKGIPRSELDATQNVLRKMQMNLTKHLAED